MKLEDLQKIFGNATAEQLEQVKRHRFNQKSSRRK